MTFINDSLLALDTTLIDLSQIVRVTKISSKRNGKGFLILGGTTALAGGILSIVCSQPSSNFLGNLGYLL
jgi:hypothetical protein